jgi:UDP-N-acetylmuramoyl-L-alanyl-D-glutamate--2,6-diaminopimelate ligase
MSSPTASVDSALWLPALPGARVEAGRPGPIAAIAYDSRQVAPGALFVAIPGFDTDGHAYLEQALAAGATALLVQADHRPQWEGLLERGAAIVSVPETRPALARVAAAFYDYPARKLGVVGVTGTDGKTTTVHLIAHVLSSAGRPTGYLSSVAFDTGGPEPELNASHMTTLEATDIQRHLAAMVEHDRRYAVVEASSHGLALHRLDCCDFDVAVLTNVGSDHLDFHGTLDAYRRAKGRLFEMIEESPPKDGVARMAVLNADDPASEEYRARTEAPAVTYAIDAAADVRARDIVDQGLAVSFELGTPEGCAPVRVALAGRHNVENCLAAAAVARSQGVTLAETAAGLEGFAGVPGRMELIDRGQPFRVVVDIASTPDALRNVLEVLERSADGRLIVMFGAAGERDPGRRDGMGRVAGQLADFSVLANEDPRSEDPDAIIEAIASGLRESGRKEGEGFVRIPDRRAAIRYAFEQAAPGDTVLLAGKATEPSIVIGREHHPWDERAVVRELLAELGWERE